MFGIRPTLTRLIMQYRNQLTSSDFNPEIMSLLQEKVRGLASGGAAWSVLVDPGSDLPERRSLTLVVLSPKYPHSEGGEGPSLAVSRLREISEKCGTRDRLYRNTLLFLLPSARGLSRLRTALRDHEALRAVKRDYRHQLDAEQQEDLEKRLQAASAKVNESLGGAYAFVAQIQGQDVEVEALSNGKPSLAEHLQSAWNQVVDDFEWVLRKVGTVTLQQSGLVPREGGIRVKDAVETFLRYTDKHMIVSREAVMSGLEKACEEGLIGIGRGVSLGNLQRRWCRQAITVDPNEEGLWIIPPFTEEPERPEETPGSTITGSAGITGSTTRQSSISDQGTGTPTQGDQEEGDRRAVAHVTIKGDVPMESWSEVFSCFVVPASKMQLKKTRLGIDFRLEAREGAPLDPDSQAFKAMIEAARQLGLEIRTE